MIQLGSKFHYLDIVNKDLEKHIKKVKKDNKYLIIKQLSLEIVNDLSYKDNFEKMSEVYAKINNQKKLEVSIVKLLFDYLANNKIVTQRIEQDFEIIQIYCLLFEIDYSFKNKEIERFNHYTNVLIKKMRKNKQIINKLGWI